MLTKLLIAISATVFAAGAAMAGAQPPAGAGHFKPFVSPSASPSPDGTLGMAILSAVVNSDATIARGAGTTGSIHLGTGLYEVDFNRDVSACMYDVTVGTTSDGSTTGVATDATRAGNVSGVFVETFDATGGATNDKSFHLVVFCAK